MSLFVLWQRVTLRIGQCRLWTQTNTTFPPYDRQILTIITPKVVSGSSLMATCMTFHISQRSTYHSKSNSAFVRVAYFLYIAWLCLLSSFSNSCFARNVKEETNREVFVAIWTARRNWWDVSCYEKYAMKCQPQKFTCFTSWSCGNM